MVSPITNAAMPPEQPVAPVAGSRDSLAEPILGTVGPVHSQPRREPAGNPPTNPAGPAFQPPTSGANSSGSRSTWVLLDRDGTLNHECHYLNDPERLELLPGVCDALVRLARGGVGLAVVTNQSGVARGLITPAQLQAIHDRLTGWLREAGVELAGIYVCPHGPEARCDCRKPAPGLALQAARDWNIDLTHAYIVGDKQADLDLAISVGATPVLVRTGYGLETERAWSRVPPSPVTVVDNLVQATDWILARQTELHTTASIAPVGRPRPARSA